MKVSGLRTNDTIIPKVLEAGAEVVENRVRSNLSSVIGTGKEPSFHGSFCPLGTSHLPCRTETAISM